MKKLLLILALVSAGVSAPAYQGEITFKQKDGSTFIGHLKGDEWFSWIEDKNNNIIKYNNKSKNYEYAIVSRVKGVLDLLPSGTKVNNSNANRTSALGISIDRNILFQIWKSRREKSLNHK